MGFFRRKGVGHSRRAGFRGWRRRSTLPLINFVTQGTFTRGSVATSWWGGNFNRHAIDELRINGSIRGYRAFLLEGPRTNQIPDSTCNSGWAVNGGATVDLSDVSNPLGEANTAPTLHFGASGSHRFEENVATFADSTDYICSGFQYNPGATWSLGHPVIQMRDKAGGTTAIRTIGDESSWTRESSITWNSSAGATTPQFRWRNNTTETRDMVVWGAQAEAGYWASSLIETAGAAASRLHDDLVISGGWTTLFAEPFQFWFVPSFSGTQLSDSGANAYLMSRNVGEYIRLENSGTNVRLRMRDDSANLITTPTSPLDAGDVCRCEIVPSTGTIRLINETQSDENEASNALISMDTGDMQVGTRTDDTHPFYGRMTEPIPL